MSLFIAACQKETNFSTLEGRYPVTCDVVSSGMTQPTINTYDIPDTLDIVHANIVMTILNVNGDELYLIEPSGNEIAAYEREFPYNGQFKNISLKVLPDQLVYIRDVGSKGKRWVRTCSCSL